MATSPVFDLGRFEHVKNTIWQTAPDDYLPIRLRQGEVIRLLEVKATQRIEDFVEQHLQFFAEVLGKEKKVRLIYMGMLLLPGRTLGEYGIEKNGLIDSPNGPNRKQYQFRATKPWIPKFAF
ncbi:uncharacterized protein CCR75_000495 [Bremia lactucae]|uniref:Ubiquitin-like domain-containing protein n=1 Tax=Bremia lactucae TaxID=4779 RepID=A0A976IG61_BRELC|nr:hypothetical protein CCR75_000495 [Bremia lactucae]